MSKEITDVGFERLIAAMGEQAFNDIVRHKYISLERELGEIDFKETTVLDALTNYDSAINFVHSEMFAEMFPNIDTEVFMKEAERRANEQFTELRNKRAAKKVACV